MQQVEPPPMHRTILSNDTSVQNTAMTPIHKILRNALGTGSKDVFNGRSGLSEMQSQATIKKQVQICSRRIRDISRLTSSSEESDSSEDSLDNERYIRKQAAYLAPW